MCEDSKSDLTTTHKINQNQNTVTRPLNEHNANILGQTFTFQQSITTSRRREGRLPMSPGTYNTSQILRLDGLRRTKNSKRIRHLSREEIPPGAEGWYVEDPNDHHPETHWKIQSELDDMPEDICLLFFENSPNNRGLHCKYCWWLGSTFLNHRHKEHIFSHTGYKPFYCEICHASYTRSENHKQHRRHPLPPKPSPAGQQ
ncbi:hypothetical protein CPB86DRAFT_365434 [Serendipita vermifera]|nr:hypothetical protein CPB86DRAFT_365434 [Serendipita vermifera]